MKSLAMLSLILYLPAFSQIIPEEVLKDWENHVVDGGRWISEDNTGAYDAWGMTFSWGVARQSMKASLYAIKGDQSIGTIWEFRIYYHPLNKSIIIEQWGSDGSFGQGNITLLTEEESESISTFYNVDGSSLQLKHVQKLQGDSKHAQTFVLAKDGSWQKSQTYIWRRVTPSDP